ILVVLATAGGSRGLSFLSFNALVVVICRYGQDTLGRVLSNDIFIQKSRDFRRSRKLLLFTFSGGSLGCTKFFFNDFIAELNALITNVHTATGEQLLNLLLALATEGTLKQVSAFLHTCHEDLST